MDVSQNHNSNVLDISISTFSQNNSCIANLMKIATKMCFLTFLEAKISEYMYEDYVYV